MTVEALAAVEAARQDGAPLDEALSEHGLDERTWSTERPRVLGEVASSASGFRAYQAALEQAQDAAYRPVTTLYDDLAAWIAYCAAIEARGPRIAEDAGLTVADLARLERHWRKRFGEDRTLAKTAKDLREAPPPDPLPAIVIGPRAPKAAPATESQGDLLAEASFPAGDELDALEQAAVLAALLAQNAGDDAFARRSAGSRAEAQATVEATTARIAGDAAQQRFFRGRLEHHRRALAQAARRPSPSPPVSLPAIEVVPKALRPNVSVAAHVAMAPGPVAAKARDLTAEVDALVIDAAPLPFRADPNASPPAPTADHEPVGAHAVGETAELTLDHLGLAATPFEPSVPLKGLAASRAMLRLLTEDPTFAESAHRWATASVNANRDATHAAATMDAIGAALGSILVVDDLLTDEVVTKLDGSLLGAQKEAAASVSEIASPSFGAARVLLDFNGTVLLEWSKKARNLAPSIVGNFQGPPSLSVAIANATSFAAASRLLKEGAQGTIARRYFKKAEKLFDKKTYHEIEAAVAAKDTKALERFLNEEFRTANGVRVFGKDAGTPLPGGGVQNGSGFIALVVFCQWSATIDALRSADGLQLTTPEGIFQAVSVTLSAASSVTVGAEAFLKARTVLGGAKFVGSKAARFLEQANIVIAGAGALLARAQNGYEAWNAWQRGDHVVVAVKVAKVAGNGVVLLCLFIPNPAVQATAMAALLAVELIEMLLDDTEPEISSPVNLHVRGLARLYVDRRGNPLSMVLTEEERAVKRQIEDWCNFQPITYHVPPGAPDMFVKADVKRLREAGLTPKEVAKFLGRPVTAEMLG